MEEFPGALGTSGSLALRLGQAIFAVASLFFMCLDGDFYGYSVFCFLVTVMALVVPWSLTLAMVDGFSIFVKPPARQPGILPIVVIGDWVLSFLSLAASSSTASVTSLMLASHGYCNGKVCARYQLSAAMALLSWFLSLSSSLFNLWLFPSV
ncbi:CASP-like protein 5C1 [Andrographis paniculata]|uniref:CASP-like protein 5C1 n=1 Tax=Andrographis paniculata TaxID=175694 RepID=UPI0021E8D555|nr:CASP-like protein 5C1 [Andrographis paniculata]